MLNCDCSIEVQANGLRQVQKICDTHKGLAESSAQMKKHAEDYMKGNGLTKLTMIMNADGVIDYVEAK